MTSLDRNSSDPSHVPGPWQEADGHLIAVGHPYPEGYVCPLSGDKEEREQRLHVLRYCEAHEVERAREVAKGGGDWAWKGIYRYELATREYVKLETVYPRDKS